VRWRQCEFHACTTRDTDTDADADADTDADTDTDADADADACKPTVTDSFP